jgi:hypothetical protein
MCQFVLTRHLLKCVERISFFLGDFCDLQVITPSLMCVSQILMSIVKSSGVECRRVSSSFVEWRRVSSSGVEWRRVASSGVEWRRVALSGVESKVKQFWSFEDNFYGLLSKLPKMLDFGRVELSRVASQFICSAALEKCTKMHKKSPNLQWN